MKVRDYIRARDEMIVTELYVELRRGVALEGSELIQRIDAAAQRARETWDREIDKRIIDAVDACEIPALSGSST